MKRFSCSAYILLLPLLLLMAAGGAYAQDKSYKDTHIKAVFLINFLDFVEWPVPQSIPKICIVNDDMLGASLAVLQTSPKARAYEVLKKSQNSNFDDCAILYLSPDTREEMRKILYMVENSSILTVSDKSGFIENRGIIEFVQIDAKMKFQINAKEAGQHNLYINSKLLKLATKVIQ